MSQHYDEIDEIIDHATDGPWEVGEVWVTAITGSKFYPEGKCAYCRFGPPEFSKPLTSGNYLHKHRGDTPYATEYLISSPDGPIVGNNEYLDGAILNPGDTRFIATFDPPTIKDIVGALRFIATGRPPSSRWWAELALQIIQTSAAKTRPSQES